MDEKPKAERLQKLIASTGAMGRRQAEVAITEGRVVVNGGVVRELGTRADPATDQIELDGHRLNFNFARITIALHKPRKIVSTRDDPEGRSTLLDLLPRELKLLKPIGRLDFDSEGLILLTNDGDLAQQVAHPSRGTQKIYEVWVEGHVSPETLRRLSDEVVLEDGPGRFEEVRELPREGTLALLEARVSEGRNRFIRRMMAAVGNPVVRLRRIQIGSLSLGRLEMGKYRILNAREVEALRSGE